MPHGKNPIAPFLEHQSYLVLDGGLATALEARGCDLNDELWSAKILLEAPELIREVHLDYLQAGADCLATCSYQASLPGFRNRGLSDEEGTALLELSVRLAREARDEFWADPSDRSGRLKPLVAASIGPYGAYLADGSEYTGTYGLTPSQLYEFHEARWQILAESGPDLIACETIPSYPETEALIRLIGKTPGLWGWISFSCRDAKHLSDGTPLRKAVQLCAESSGIAAVGVNCVPPELIPSLLREARGASDLPVFAYPNSGERYDAITKTWYSSPSSLSWDTAVPEWAKLGAAGIGGCCRVDPEGIKTVRAGLHSG